MYCIHSFNKYVMASPVLSTLLDLAYLSDQNKHPFYYLRIAGEHPPSWSLQESLGRERINVRNKEMMSFIRTRQVLWKKWSWVWDLECWGLGVRLQFSVGWLGLEKDLPGLVTFEERLEGVRRLDLQVSAGRLSQMEGTGSTKEWKWECAWCVQEQQEASVAGARAAEERGTLVRISFYSKAAQ